MTDPTPSEIQLKTYSRKLVLSYGDQSHELDFEFLRVLSPSAEVQGHGQPILQIGKENVMITNLEPVGNYAIKITFNDGHDSGIQHRRDAGQNAHIQFTPCMRPCFDGFEHCRCHGENARIS